MFFIFYSYKIFNFVCISIQLFQHTTIMENLEKRVKAIKTQLHNCSDIIIKKISSGKNAIFVMYIDGLIEQNELNLNILAPLYKFKSFKSCSLEDIKTKIVNFSNAEILKDKDIENNLLRGYALLFVNGDERALGFNIIHYDGRSVEEPPTSAVINGPREGFVENIKINVALIRKRLVCKHLKIEDMTVGNRTQTAVKLMYLDDVVDKRVVREVKEKINKIDIDGVLDSYYVGTFLEDKPNSIFRQVGNCEKPDIAVSKILEGRVAIVVDGSPIVLTVPLIAFEDFQSSNDYYSEPHKASTLRILRIIALIMSIYLPGMYIALRLYHYKVLPLKFLITVVNSTQNLPFNPFLEILFIIVLFDVLFEASLRMPKYLGVAVSIVGALILGDTAVQAGLVSHPGVMIVAMSGITIYILPNQSAQVSLLRFIFALIGGVLGLHGLVLSSMFLFGYLANFDSYNTPYLAPLAPYVKNDQKDFIFKENITEMKTLPKSIPNSQDTRLNDEELKKENTQDSGENINLASLFGINGNEDESKNQKNENEENPKNNQEEKEDSAKKPKNKSSNNIINKDIQVESNENSSYKKQNNNSNTMKKNLKTTKKNDVISKNKQPIIKSAQEVTKIDKN